MSLALHNLRFAYRAPLFEDLNLEIAPGSCVGILGPNGSGKSTLLQLMAGVLKPSGGELLLAGKKFGDYSRKALSQRLGFLPQQESLNFPFTVREVVLMGRFPYQRGLGPDSTLDHEIAQEALSATDSVSLASRIFSTLSGGEQRRVLLARLLAQQADFWLLDEPMAHLDLKQQMRIETLLLNFRKKHTLILSLHDLNFALYHCDRVLLLKSGSVVADGAPERVLDPERLSEIFEAPIRRLRDTDSGRIYYLGLNYGETEIP